MKKSLQNLQSVVNFFMKELNGFLCKMHDLNVYIKYLVLHNLVLRFLVS